MSADPARTRQWHIAHARATDSNPPHLCAAARYVMRAWSAAVHHRTRMYHRRLFRLIPKEGETIRFHTHDVGTVALSYDQSQGGPVAVDELTHIKSALSELARRDAATPRRKLGADHRPGVSHSELNQLQSLLSADSDLGRLAEILTRRRDEQRKALLAVQEEMRSEAQKWQLAAAASLAAATAARVQALELLAEPFTSTYVTLPEPLLIWELPHPELNIWRDDQIVPGGSWVKLILETKSSPAGQSYTDFRFYFLWENPTDYYAVANVSSSLSLNGQADAWGNPGIISGDHADLDVSAYLTVMRWSGWPNDPITGQSENQTPYPVYDWQDTTKSVVAFDAFGGDWFDSADPKSASFDPSKPYDVNADLVAIPGGAVTLFEVGLTIGWSFHNIDGDNVESDYQSITLDLGYDPLGYRAVCPMVQLEVLTPLPASSAT
jgi:hypothetical protein